MTTIDKVIAESTECDFKAELEKRKPKSWLKTVSAFANGLGGSLFFGVSDDRNVVGLREIQTDAEFISRFIRDRITPIPRFRLIPTKEDDKDILILIVFAGSATPYYYKADGVMEAYVRIGNESVTAPNYIINDLIIKGMNQSYDSLGSEYKYNDYTFYRLYDRYKSWTKSDLTEKIIESMGIKDLDGKLTYAGALLADNSPIRQSRLFCTRWNGVDKSGGTVDALDSAEFSGSIIMLLNEGLNFIKRNMKVRWKKTANARIEMPDYDERSVLESLVNALIHRDYLIIGSEIHIDIFDDRLLIYSPGGMPDGTCIQNRDIAAVPSVRRNPVLADIFDQLGYMERKGSGFSKICSVYRSNNNKTGKKPEFFSSRTEFTVILPNLNFKTSNNEAVNEVFSEVFNDIEKAILIYFIQNPDATQILAIENLPYSKRKIQETMKRLREKSLLKHVGSKRRGCWLVQKELSSILLNLNFKTSNNEVFSEVLNDTERNILKYFLDNSNATQILAIENLPYSKRKIQETMKILQKKGLLNYVGPKKSGYWTVNIDEKDLSLMSMGIRNKEQIR